MGGKAVLLIAAAMALSSCAHQRQQTWERANPQYTSAGYFRWQSESEVRTSFAIHAAATMHRRRTALQIGAARVVTGYAVVGYTGTSADVRIPPQRRDAPVNEIGANAFRGSGLASVTIPDSVAAIGYGAFALNPLASVTIGNGVSVLRENAFGGSLETLSRISIGANVTLEGTSSAAWMGFREAYEENGQRAGVYTFSDGAWNWQRR